MNEIILDTETTGLSIEKGDRIIEIACVETKDLIPTKKVFYELINPETEISDDAYKIHGYTYEKLKSKKKFAEIVEDFLKFIEGKKLIIHNAPFDISFINNELKKLKKEPINFKSVVDTLELARSKFPGASNSLDNLCKKFNIDNSKRTKHNALLDCELLREVYINLLDVKEPKLVFSSDKIENNERNYINHSTRYYKKVLRPNVI